MKINFKVWVLAVIVVSGAGCTSIDRECDIETPPVAEVEVRKSLISSEISYRTADGYFEISGDKDGLKAFEVKKKEADIRDLAAFGSAIYRSELASKLRNGEQLSIIDEQLLRFCIDSQVSVLKSYWRLGIQAMLNESKIASPLECTDYKEIASTLEKTFKQQVEEKSYQLQHDFYTSDSVMQKKILEWGKYFHIIDDKILVSDMIRIRKSDTQAIDDFQWRQLWLYVPYLQYITLLWNKEFHETKSLRPYKGFNGDEQNIAMQWEALNASMSYPISDLQVMYEDMGTFIKKIENSRDRVKIDDLRLEVDNNIRHAIREHCYVFTDLPFIVFCKKAYIDIQNCKSAYNDNEDAMEAVINKFLVCVNGADMLMQIRSPYTSDIYVQLLELFKGELGKKRYENYLTSSKLYELNEFSPSYFGKNKVK